MLLSHKFKQVFLKKSWEISWRFRAKDCAAKVTTDASCQAVLNGSLANIHEINPRKLERQILRTACKRKATDQISERPSKIISSDYVLTYIDDTTATFSTSTWSEVPSLVRRNNNGSEAFHSHYNEQFYKSHPSMFISMDNLTKLQAITYVKLRSTNAEAVHTRKELEKEQFLIEKYSKLMCNDVNSFTILSMCLTDF